MTNVKVTAGADCAASEYSPSSTFKSSCPLTVRGPWSFRQKYPPPSNPTYIQNTAKFPFHETCLFFAFRVVSSQMPLLVTQPGNGQKLERKTTKDRNFRHVNLGKVGEMHIYLQTLEIGFILENNKYRGLGGNSMNRNMK